MLFGEHGEDEVVVGDGQELVLPLRAVAEPLPVSPPDPTVTRAWIC